MNNEELQKVVEQLKASMSIEELDELERQYNEMLKKIKESEESNDEPMFGNH